MDTGNSEIIPSNIFFSDVKRIGEFKMYALLFEQTRGKRYLALYDF